MAGLIFFWQQESSEPPTPSDEVGPIRLRGTITIGARSSGSSMRGASITGLVTGSARMSGASDVEEEG
jgi:hypothetical protein